MSGKEAAHFQHLSKATEGGKVILAGRTDEARDKTFGLTLHPYSIALQPK